MLILHTRREFLTTLSLTGAAGLVGQPRAFAAEGALETPTVRIPKISQGGGGICAAPERIVGELLRAEGFADVRLVPSGPSDLTQAVGDGTLDFALNFASSLTTAIDRGVAIRVLAGIHAGCFGLFGHEAIADRDRRFIGFSHQKVQDGHFSVERPS
jgi:NitT/TauT family transport system substrate-binding protein